MLTPHSDDYIRPRDQLPSHEEFCNLDANQFCAFDFTPAEIVFMFEEECRRRGVDPVALWREEIERHQGDFD